MSTNSWSAQTASVPMNATGWGWLFGYEGVLMNSWNCSGIKYNTRVSNGISQRWQNIVGCDGYCWMNIWDGNTRLDNATLTSRLSACMAANYSTGYPAEMCCDLCGPAPSEVSKGIRSQYCGLSPKPCGKYNPPAPAPTPGQSSNWHIWNNCFNTYLGIPPIQTSDKVLKQTMCVLDNMTSGKYPMLAPKTVFPYYDINLQIPGGGGGTAERICASMAATAYFKRAVVPWDKSQSTGSNWGLWSADQDDPRSPLHWNFRAPFGNNMVESMGSWMYDTYDNNIDCSAAYAEVNSTVYNLSYPVKASLWGQTGFGYNDVNWDISHPYVFKVAYDCGYLDGQSNPPDYVSQCLAGYDARSPISLDAGFSFESTVGHYNSWLGLSQGCQGHGNGWGQVYSVPFSNPTAYTTRESSCAGMLATNVDQNLNMQKDYADVQLKPDFSWDAIPAMCSAGNKLKQLGLVCGFNVNTNSRGYPSDVSVGTINAKFCPVCACNDLTSLNAPECMKYCPPSFPTPLPTPAPTPMPAAAFAVPRYVPPPAVRDNHGRHPDAPPDPPFFFQAARFVEKKTGQWGFTGMWNRKF